MSDNPAVPEDDTPPVIHIISDGLGDSAAALAAAAASQFYEGTSTIHRLPKVNCFKQIQAFIDSSLDEADGEIVLFHTITNPSLRTELERYVVGKPIAAVDLIGPAISAITQATGRIPKGEPGLLRLTNRQYFNRIEAMEYAVEHDDGRNIEQIDQADIVLIGASRTSKTPLSIYLASYGYKVANVPLTVGIDAPSQLFELDHRRIFGLTSTPELLSEIRYARLGNATGVAASYAEISSVQDDLDDARQLMRSLGCIVVRTNGRSIEETAQEILRYYTLTFPASDSPASLN